MPCAALVSSRVIWGWLIVRKVMGRPPRVSLVATEGITPPIWFGQVPILKSLALHPTTQQFVMHDPDGDADLVAGVYAYCDRLRQWGALLPRELASPLAGRWPS